MIVRIACPAPTDCAAVAASKANYRFITDQPPRLPHSKSLASSSCSSCSNQHSTLPFQWHSHGSKIWGHWAQLVRGSPHVHLYLPFSLPFYSFPCPFNSFASSFPPWNSPKIQVQGLGEWPGSAAAAESMVELRPQKHFYHICNSVSNT